MQVPQIVNQKQAVISVWLDENKKDERTLKRFYCPICGRVVFEYYNRLRMLVPGVSPAQNQKIVQCSGKLTIHKDGHKINTTCKARFCIE